MAVQDVVQVIFLGEAQLAPEQVRPLSRARVEDEAQREPATAWGRRAALRVNRQDLQPVTGEDAPVLLEKRFRDLQGGAVRESHAEARERQAQGPPLDVQARARQEPGKRGVHEEELAPVQLEVDAIVEVISQEFRVRHRVLILHPALDQPIQVGGQECLDRREFGEVVAQRLRLVPAGLRAGIPHRLAYRRVETGDELANGLVAEQRERGGGGGRGAAGWDEASWGAGGGAGPATWPGAVDGSDSPVAVSEGNPSVSVR